MSIDSEHDRDQDGIANLHPKEIEEEQGVAASVRWNEIWFLLIGFCLLFGIVTWMLMAV
jgi:hypothetical protein